MNSAALTFLTTFGVLVVGAYAGALADRFAYWFHVSRSLLWKKHCPECFSPQAWATAVPVCGYVVQRGVCSSCRALLPLSSIFSEILGAVVAWGIFVAAFGSTLPYSWLEWIHAVVLVAALIGGIILFFSDLVYDEVPVSVYVFTLISLGIAFAITGGMDAVMASAQASILAGVLMFALAAVSGFKWVHAHDILLGMLVGCIVGWPAIVITLAFTYILAIIGALATWGFKITIYKGTSSFGLYLFVALLLQGFLAWITG